MENILSGNLIIRDMPDVLEEVEDYLALRIDENEENFKKLKIWIYEFIYLPISLY